MGTFGKGSERTWGNYTVQKREVILTKSDRRSPAGWNALQILRRRHSTGNSLHAHASLC